MFDRLSDSFSNAFRSISGRGKISEANIRESMREIRTALLEADVDYAIAKEFCDNVVEQALGQEVTKSLKPGQQMVGIVNDALIDLMRGDDAASQSPEVAQVSPGPTVIMMAGLQGSGKTTSCGKLANYLRKRGRSVMLAAADLQRPAAVDQLETIASQLQAESGPAVEFYAERDRVAEYGKAVGAAVAVCQNALRAAQKAQIDTLILDTAGRLHVNDELMRELESVRTAVRPHQTFLVIDAMTGQDAVNSAKTFHERLGIDGSILSKFDSDTRGGAALTVKKITGAPILFVGVGERLTQLEEFHPERVASRILGMGDVVSLVEKAQQEVSEEEAEALQAKMAKGELGFDDFLKQMRTLRRMGPMKQLLGMLPGVGSALKDVDIDDKQLNRLEGMVNSMTPAERRDAKIITTPRRKRIAAGSGTHLNDVNRLITQFQSVAKLSKQMAGMSGSDRARAAEAIQSGAMPGLPGMGKKGTKSGSSSKKRFKQRRRR